MNSPRPSPDLLTGLLRDVSRSFYLTLRILPAPVRRPIGLGYLLARATDTLADTTLVPVDRRLQALTALANRIQGSRVIPLDFGEFLEPSATTDSTERERQLLARIEETITALNQLAEADRQEVRKVLTTITSGQSLDLVRFGAASSEQIVALKTCAELTDYTYRVAGCVGEFWTRLCRRHLFPAHPVNESELLADGVRFGQGLQLINIMRDLPKDLRQGRCYVPGHELSQLGLVPDELRRPANELRFRPLYHRLLNEARAHLDAGWRYTNTLPQNQWRLRLSCAWPLLIGRKTLDRLRTANVLDATQRVKITRSEVRQVLSSSVWRVPFSRAWGRLWSE